MAAEFEMMHLQIPHAAASLAAPSVAFQHLPMQVSITRRVESKSRTFSADLLHEAFWLTSEKSLLLWTGQELVVAGDGLQQDFRVAAVDRGPGEEVRTDHFQAVPSRLVRPQHRLENGFACGPLPGSKLQGSGLVIGL